MAQQGLFNLKKKGGAIKLGSGRCPVGRIVNLEVGGISSIRKRALLTVAGEGGRFDPARRAGSMASKR